MFLCNNFSTSQRKKHIGIRRHFVRGYIEDDILKVVFFRSEDNDADMFSNNVTEDLYVQHSTKLIAIPPK
jgi:hypothetical protein